MNFERQSIYSLKESFQPLPKHGIEDVYAVVIAELRNYSVQSIVAAALQSLWQQRSMLDDLQSAPWLSLLIVKWAIQDRKINLRVGAAMSVHHLDLLKQQLWETDVLPSKPNLHLLVRANLHGQALFQRGTRLGFLRWPALIARLKPQQPTRRQFVTRMGMEPQAYIDLSFALAGAVQRRQMPIAPDWLGALRGVYGNAVDGILSLFARSLGGLRDELQNEDAQKIRGKFELIEFPYLQRFPLLKLRNGRLHAWHPKVFEQGLEDAVHLRLSELGPGYTEPFSRVFEGYVTELAVSAGVSVVTEAAYKAVAGHTASAVEAIFPGRGCNIFVEAKMSLFADDVLLTDNETVAFQKTKRLRDAIGQAWAVGEKIRAADAPLGSRVAHECDFLLIVTSRELLISGGEMLASMYAPNQFRYPSDAARRRLPLSRILILSIEDYENLIGAVARGEVDLFEIVEQATTANSSPDAAQMFFSAHLSKRVKRWQWTPLLDEAFRSSADRLSTALGQGPFSISMPG